MKNKVLLASSTVVLLSSIFLLSQLSLALPVNKPLQRIVDDYSLNWAGYYVTGSGYTYASATWTVPAVSNTTSGHSSAWVGIGGVNGNGLIQTGTEQECLSSTSGGGPKFHGPVLVNPPNGGVGGSSKKSSTCTPVYYVWWETYPANAEQSISSISVSPGDTMSAYVQKVNDSSWVISITDITNGQSFQTTVNFSPDQTTAEVIIERPALCFVNCKLTSLANFGIMQFSQAAAQTSGNYFNLLSNKPITMLDNGYKIMAYPSSLTNPGTFSVTWVRSN